MLVATNFFGSIQQLYWMTDGSQINKTNANCQADREFNSKFRIVHLTRAVASNSNKVGGFPYGHAVTSRHNTRPFVCRTSIWRWNVVETSWSNTVVKLVDVALHEQKKWLVTTCGFCGWHLELSIRYNWCSIGHGKPIFNKLFFTNCEEFVPITSWCIIELPKKNMMLFLIFTTRTTFNLK